MPFSSGFRAGQWTSAAAFLAAAAAWVLAGPASGAAGPRVTPSGQPVPRYVSTRFKEVNARGGPGDDYKLVWTFHATGIPLQVVEETFDWRRVCDPEGGLAWVHRRTVDADRRVMNLSEADIPLYGAAKSGARQTALLAGRSTATLEVCKDGWCRIKAGKVTAFVQQQAVWGADDARQCRPPAG